MCQDFKVSLSTQQVPARLDSVLNKTKTEINKSLKYYQSCMVVHTFNLSTQEVIPEFKASLAT